MEAQLTSAPDRIASPVVRARVPRSWAFAALATLACLLYVAWQQFGALRHQHLQVDELFFGACASRGLIDGLATVAGCHDNKAPLIYLLHGLIQSVSHPFDALPLKLTSGLLLAAIATLAAVIARRAAHSQPHLAALATTILLMAALVPNPSLLAVKTELLGMLFVLMALALAPRERIRTRHALGIGLALGLALMSKQSYLFLLPIGIWLVWRASRNESQRRRGGLQLAHAAGLALPFALLAALFAANGRLQEFLGTTFLYPAVYGDSAAPPSLFKALLWRSTAVSEFLQFTPIHIALVLLAGLAIKDKATSTPQQRSLLMACGLALVILLVAPVLFNYHVIPFWILASIIGGVALADAHAAGGRSTLFAAAALLAAALLGLGMTLRQNSGLAQPDTLAASLEPSAGRYAYVLGMEPAFYARGFIPASSVQFPWALPGTPGTWAYRPPAPGSWVYEVLQAQQQRNLAQLYQDFARTPPAYIVTTDLYARSAGSQKYTDVPQLDDYLARHCEHQGDIADSRGHPGHLFACRPVR